MDKTLGRPVNIAVGVLLCGLVALIVFFFRSALAQALHDLTVG